MPALDEEVSGPPLPEVPFADVPALIAARAAMDPARVAVRQRGLNGKLQDLTWGKLDQRRLELAAGLLGLGVKPGDRVAVVAQNSAEMLLAELAILSAGAASVPIFPDYAPEVLLHCLNDCGARVAFAGSAVQQHRLAQAKSLQNVIVLDDQPLPDVGRSLPLKALERAPEALPAPGETAFVLYTGGTTGKPKGVELTHANLLSQQAAMAPLWDVSERDVFLSYLPWHHCFGSLFERFMALWHRATLVLDDSRGRDLDKLLANWAEVKPTVYFGVPRVFAAMAQRARRDAKARAAVLHAGLRFVFSAAAPLSAPVFKFFEDGGVPVLEGWGLTETSPCVTVTTPRSPRAPGAVGFPLPGTTVKLKTTEGVPAGRGEALVRGPQVMRGYLGQPEETARLLESSGFLHTGDLAEWTAHGLQLHGRVDGVFKLENGEKVSAGEVEARILAATPLLEQALALGAGQPFVTALCWIAPGPARRYLLERELDAPQNLRELALVPELRRAIVEALQAANLLAGVPYERVRRVALMPDAPSLEAGEVNSTLRLVRPVLEERRKELIVALRDETPNPHIVDIFRRGDPFQHA